MRSKFLLSKSNSKDNNSPALQLTPENKKKLGFKSNTCEGKMTSSQPHEASKLKKALVENPNIQEQTLIKVKFLRNVCKRLFDNRKKLGLSKMHLQSRHQKIRNRERKFNKPFSLRLLSSIVSRKFMQYKRQAFQKIRSTKPENYINNLTNRATMNFQQYQKLYHSIETLKDNLHIKQQVLSLINMNDLLEFKYSHEFQLLQNLRLKNLLSFYDKKPRVCPVPALTNENIQVVNMISILLKLRLCQSQQQRIANLI